MPAVHNATFDVFEGEILIVMGLSGSGKSTLIRCLARLVEPTYGRVMFEGIDLLQAGKQELIEIRRHKIGMVFQHFALLPHRTVLQNIVFPLEVQGIDRGRAGKAGVVKSYRLLDWKVEETTTFANCPAGSSKGLASDVRSQLNRTCGFWMSPFPHLIH